ncbi:MAG: GGDEF domain-containing protein [Pseudomonadota bacterium]
MNSERVPENLAIPDPLLDGVNQVVTVIFGPDRTTRARTAAILLCALIYAICCWAAFHGASIGIMRAFAPKLLVITTIPAYAIFYSLVRSGWSKRLQDKTLMIPQIIFALMSISFAYTAVGPSDRGMVLVLIPLVMVFGMYTHTPRHSVQVGLLAMLMLGASTGLLSQWDPTYYPPAYELIRFEMLAGTVPSLIFSAYQISSWRNRLAQQRSELKEALAKVQELASRDALTGLYNRRYMQDKLDNCVQRFDRYGERFTVTLIDLDHFKRVNDQHGHRVGDEVLVSFATAAGIVLRDTDTIARWGGEEFLVLMPNTSEHKALAAMERLRGALTKCVTSATEPSLKVTFSAGVALHDSITPLTQTIERADKALYQAKHEGRDRAIAAPSSGQR